MASIGESKDKTTANQRSKKMKARLTFTKKKKKKHLNDPQDLCEKPVVSGMNLNSSSSIRLRYFKHAVHAGNLQIWPN